jgi:hypothetical protein
MTVCIGGSRGPQVPAAPEMSRAYLICGIDGRESFPSMVSISLGTQTQGRGLIVSNGGMHIHGPMNNCQDVDLIRFYEIDYAIRAFNHFPNELEIILGDFPARERMLGDLQSPSCQSIDHAPGVLRRILCNVMINCIQMSFGCVGQVYLQSHKSYLARISVTSLLRPALLSARPRSIVSRTYNSCIRSSQVASGGIRSIILWASSLTIMVGINTLLHIKTSTEPRGNQTHTFLCRSAGTMVVTSAPSQDEMNSYNVTAVVPELRRRAPEGDGFGAVLARF